MALEMILGVQLFKDDPSGKIAGIVPLAFPIIAGAGTMTSLISLRAEYDMINICLAIAVNILIVWLVLQSTKAIEKVLGEGGISNFEKGFWDHSIGDRS